MTQFTSIFAFLVFPPQCWLTMMHSTNMMPHASCVSLHNHLCLMLDFSLSLYCSWCLYLVMPRRQTSDQWLGQSLGQPGQCLSCPLQHMSQSFFLSKASLVQYLLSFSLVCILYFVICFWAVSQTSANALSMAWAGLTSHRTCCSQTLAICFILFLHM